MSPRVSVIRGVWSGGSSLVFAATRRGKRAGLIAEREAAVAAYLTDVAAAAIAAIQPTMISATAAPTAIKAFSGTLSACPCSAENTGRANRAALVPGRASPHRSVPEPELRPPLSWSGRWPQISRRGGKAEWVDANSYMSFLQSWRGRGHSPDSGSRSLHLRHLRGCLHR